MYLKISVRVCYYVAIVFPEWAVSFKYVALSFTMVCGDAFVRPVVGSTREHTSRCCHHVQQLTTHAYKQEINACICSEEIFVTV